MRVSSVASSLFGRPQLRRMPWPLLAGAMLLTCIGALFIRSSHPAPGMAWKHLVWAGLGLVAFGAVAFVDYRNLSLLTVPLYAGAVLALLGLPLFGVTINSARRWYDLGFFKAQPSEPMKYILVLTLASYWRFRDRKGGLSDLVAPLALTLLPMLLIAQQPDVGTAMVLAPVFVSTAYLAGVRMRTLIVLAGVGCAVAAVGWFTPGVLKDYQKQRVLTFIDPAADDESPASYNARQAITAISSGGPYGRGWGAGVLNRLGRIPERHTDFIFPVVAEEWGFVRTAPIICVYLGLTVYMLLRAAALWEPCGRLLVGGMATIFGFQAFLNMAIALRLAPITGLTLPFISYGGSSLVSTYAAFGLVASACMHQTPGYGVDGPAG